MQEQLCHIKLKTGEDMLATVHWEAEDCSDNPIKIVEPIILVVDPEHGLYAKKWFNLSNADTAWLENADYYFCTKASREATSHYNRYLKRQKYLDEMYGDDDSDIDSDTEMSGLDDAESLIAALLESRMSTKH